MRRTKLNVAAVVLAGLISLTAVTSPACVSSSGPSSETSTPSAENPPLALPGGMFDFTDVLNLVTPSVVAINTQVQTVDVFNRPVQREGAGSGWVYDSKGLIVTNHHVIADASKITVTLSDGSIYSATLVGSDSLADLAVLRVNVPDLPALSVADFSQVERGDWVLSIGNSLGLGVTAKQGIVSRLDVSLPVSEGQTADKLIETSAAINPGNSGGPLVNMQGQVIGITSLKISASGVEGLGYAICTSCAIPIINKLIEKGYINRPWLGVSVRTVTSSVARTFGLSVDTGALVVEVAAGSPAEKSGIQVGDVIVSFGDKIISNSQELQDAVQSSETGVPVNISFWRNDKAESSVVTLEESPAPTASSS